MTTAISAATPAAAHRPTETPPPMTLDDTRPIDDATAWRAVLDRDRSYDDRFVTGVLSTGIYCRPSCGARNPKRENVRFFADGAAARAAGLRPCKRCHPDDVARDRLAVNQALERIEARVTAGEKPPGLAELAEVADYSPQHFQRLFKARVGVSPAAYARALRARRAEAVLGEEERVTDAVYEAGYGAPSRFYEETGKRLGMTPSAWRDGGVGVTIRWAVADTDLGPMLVAATERGICRLSFEEGEAELRERFPKASVEPGGSDFDELVERAVAAVDRPAEAAGLPLDVQGTAFQEAVWRELSRIPPGETASYAALAARTGRPQAARAAGSACGANPVAVLIPCHRATRTDGSLGGYAYGLERKKELLDRER